MSAEPVTITTQLDTATFNPEDHRRIAAERLGLDPADIHPIDAAMPDSIEEVSPDVYDEDGVLIEPRVLSYTRVTTWEPKPAAPEWVQPQEPPTPEIVTWPTHSAPRGSKWHGAVTIDGVTAEHTFIGTGEKLVLLDSPAGKAVMDALDAEHAAHQSGEI